MSMKNYIYRQRALLGGQKLRPRIFKPKYLENGVKEVQYNLHITYGILQKIFA